MATQENAPIGTRVHVRVTPVDAPEASEYYANVTGVGITQSDLVMLFARMLPLEVAPDRGEIQVEPHLRVIMPVSAAQNLVRQLQEQLGKHREVMATIRQEEPRDVGS